MPEKANSPAPAPSASVIDYAGCLLAALETPSDGATACEESLPRLSTFAAMQGLWRPTLGSNAYGTMVVIPRQNGQEVTVCGITVEPDKEPSGLLQAYPIAAGRCAQVAVTGDWATIEQAADALCLTTLGGLGATAAGPWFCLFQTNPRSTEPQDWESLICVPIAP